MKNKRYDVIINGGGMVGATMAGLLAKQGKKVAVIEAFKVKKVLKKDPYELRVSAISKASKKALVDAGAWDSIVSQRVSPYEKMIVWDAAGDGLVEFDAAQLGEPELGHIIENRAIQFALTKALKQDERVGLYCPDSLSHFSVDDDQVHVELESGKQLSAQLLIGADGAHSRVRALANIDFERDDYGQSGLVCVVKTEKHHEYTAWQRFQVSGPLAFLPLSDGSCSIVWTLPSDRADYYLSRSDDDFKAALGEALDYKLGEITELGQRATFPLKGSQAKQYVKPRIALLGDAAHTIHPLAGQGVNLGLKDAVALSQVLSSVTPGNPGATKDLGSYKLLRRYERARRGDNVLTMRAMEAFRLLFGHSAAPVKTLRNMGMKLFNQTPVLKNEIVKKAMGF
jgi:2-octaprenylphenol hydroxylase